jgi:predicted phage tail protein
LKPIPAKIEQIGWPLSWEPVSGAARYHTEVSTQADFSLILWERYSDGARTPLPDLADGSYYVRVRAIDDLGIEGLDRQQQIELDARPQPPVPLAPRDDGVTRSPTPQLSWSDSSEAKSYRLQLASDPTFSQLQLERNQLTSTSLQTPALPLGKYHWRLASISPSGEQGPYGPSRSFEIKPEPAKPEPSIAGDKEKVVASWQPGVEGQTYQVQVAEDAKFMTLLNDESIAEPQLELPQVKGKLRYLRVRIVEPDGYRGPWGAVQKIDPLPDRGWAIVLITGLLGILLL